MKKFLCMLLAALLAVCPLFALATESRENEDIQETKIVEEEPIDPEEEPEIPEVGIVPDTEDVENLREELQTVFRLNIRYIYVDGSVAADPYDAILAAGTPYSVPSPTITGYTASQVLISGTMPDRDLQFTVIYVSENGTYDVFDMAEIQSLYSFGDYETPLGVGFLVSNIGYSGE